MNPRAKREKAGIIYMREKNKQLKEHIKDLKPKL
jgi:hypothetical protein